jgi:hypothetical protein
MRVPRSPVSQARGHFGHLPRVAASPATDAPHAEPLPRGQGNILLVDDAVAVAHVQVVLEHLGYRVIVPQ